MAMITLQTKPETPNAVYVPQFMLQTGINNGKFITSCQITLAAVKGVNVGTKDEQWVSTGQTQMIFISDIANPEPDLAKFGTQMNKFYTDLMALLEAINATRKVV